MKYIGISLIICLLLWLLLHKRNDQQEYLNGLALGASKLHHITQHYLL